MTDKIWEEKIQQPTKILLQIFFLKEKDEIYISENSQKTFFLKKSLDGWPRPTWNVSSTDGFLPGHSYRSLFFFKPVYLF